MSWISDVQDELRSLDRSRASLKKFGVTVGVVSGIIAIGLFVAGSSPLLPTACGILGIFLVLGGLAIPRGLSYPYILWMGIAFSLGWLVSRIILVVLFYCVVTPIAFTARIFGKRFMETRNIGNKESYWIPKQHPDSGNYEKMS